MVRVLYTDVDGTLVGPLGNLLWDSNRRPSLAAADALVRAARGGLEVVALTGRSRPGMFEVARLLGLETYFCELGGFRVYARGEDVVCDFGAFPGEGTPRAALQRAVDGLLTRFAGQVEEHSPWNAARESSLVLRGHLDPPEAEAFLADTGFGWADVHDNGVIPRRYESLAGLERVHAYHLVPRGVSKAAAIAADRRFRGIPRAETAMVGDAAADAECRTEVGRCFLVANGLVKDPALAWAREPGSGVEVTDGSHGDGFAEVVSALLGGTPG